MNTIIFLAAATAAVSAAQPSVDAILDAPRRPMSRIELPEEGIFFGSSVYGGHTNVVFLYTGQAHNRWTGSCPTQEECVRLTKELGLGNTLQFWSGGANLAKFSAYANSLGLYSMNIYSDASVEEIKRIEGLGAHWLGYDTGECFHFTGSDSAGKERPTLQDVADGFVRRVADHVAKRRAKGWGNIMSTGADFSMDYQVLGGIDIPCTEDMPFRNLMLSSAMNRGVVKLFNLPMWGSHNAHEWNAFIPYSNPLRLPLLFASFQLKYMTGAKLIINESGNWQVQSTLCQDSPEHDMPQVYAGKPGIHGADRKEVAPYLKEAEAKNHLVSYDSDVCRGYREQMAKFWEFVKRNPAPKGQPQAVLAVAKGNLDLSSEDPVPTCPIGGAQSVADRDANWYRGHPEDTFRLVENIFFPRPKDVLKPSKNMFLGGTPYGLVDLTSFAYDRTSAEHLLKNYKAVMFAGWNTCSPKQYKILCDYVKGGGKLLIALPHLSCDKTRRYANFTKEDLVNGGDFSELCGIKVKGRTDRVWWATAAERVKKPNTLGFPWPRRFGILNCLLGDLEFTGPGSDYEMMAVDDEASLPIVVRAKRGKGEVFFINTWCYPAAANTDEGPGATYDSEGLMPLVYKYVASLARGDVYTTGEGLDRPDANCDYVICTYFPEDGRIFLKNVDFRNPRRFDLHRFGKTETIVLEPAEMRILK